MKVKDSTVNIWGLEKEMQPVLSKAEAIYKEHGQELVITSARDRMHSAGSLHYYGYAVDLRTNYFEGETEELQVVSELKDALGQDYDVLLEINHIHVEYQRALEGL